MNLLIFPALLALSSSSYADNERVRRQFGFMPLEFIEFGRWADYMSRRGSQRDPPDYSAELPAHNREVGEVFGTRSSVRKTRIQPHNVPSGWNMEDSYANYANSHRYTSNRGRFSESSTERDRVREKDVRYYNFPVTNRDPHSVFGPPKANRSPFDVPPILYEREISTVAQSPTHDQYVSMPIGNQKPVEELPPSIPNGDHSKGKVEVSSPATSTISEEYSRDAEQEQFIEQAVLEDIESSKETSKLPASHNTTDVPPVKSTTTTVKATSITSGRGLSTTSALRPPPLPKEVGRKTEELGILIEKKST